MKKLKKKNLNCFSWLAFLQIWPFLLGICFLFNDSTPFKDITDSMSLHFNYDKAQMYCFKTILFIFFTFQNVNFNNTNYKITKSKILSSIIC